MDDIGQPANDNNEVKVMWDEIVDRIAAIGNKVGQEATVEAFERLVQIIRRAA